MKTTNKPTFYLHTKILLSCCVCHFLEDLLPDLRLTFSRLKNKNRSKIEIRTTQINLEIKKLPLVNLSNARKNTCISSLAP